MHHCKPKLWGKISSHIDDLDRLQSYYKWIPNSSTVRPSPSGKEAKAQQLQLITEKYVHFADYIYHTVFEAAMSEFESDGKLRSSESCMKSFLVFRANQFPYCIEEGNHFILWYCSPIKLRTDEQITEDIASELRKIHRGLEVFDFAWYENPKMTVPELYHVQVFWIPL